MVSQQPNNSRLPPIGLSKQLLAILSGFTRYAGLLGERVPRVKNLTTSSVESVNFSLVRTSPLTSSRRVTPSSPYQSLGNDDGSISYYRRSSKNQRFPAHRCAELVMGADLLVKAS